MKRIACIFLTLAILLSAFDLQVEVDKKLSDISNTSVSSLNHCSLVYLEPIHRKSDSPKYSLKVKFNPLSVSLPFQKFTPGHSQLIKGLCFLPDIVSYTPVTQAVITPYLAHKAKVISRNTLFCVYRV